MGKLCNQFTFCFWTAWLTQSLLLHYHDIIYILHEHTVVFQAFIALSINTIYIIYIWLYQFMTMSIAIWMTCHHQLMPIDSTSSSEHPVDIERSINSSLLCPSQLHTLKYYITLHSGARHVIQGTPPSFPPPCVHTAVTNKEDIQSYQMTLDFRVTGHTHRLHRFSFTSVVFPPWLTRKETTFQISAQTIKDYNVLPGPAQKASLHSKVPQQVL